MIKSIIGNDATLDIHGGGNDLIFPHHENEIAQSRCANDSKIFAKYWVHNAFITMSNEKMAKSQGNILKIKNFRNNTSGQVIRLALMSAHYKQPLDWNDKLISDCQNTLDKWYRVYSSEKNSVQVTKEILKPLYDDLNTPGYIANLHQLFDQANKGNNKELFVSACKFVGLFNEDKEQWEKYKQDKATISESEINNKIDLRNKARADKNYNYSILTKKLSHNAGIKKGKIINFDYTVKTINKDLQDIEQKAKIVFKNISVVLNQKDIFCTNLSGFKKLNGSKVEKRDLDYILNEAKSSISKNQEKNSILHLSLIHI